jgi:hypothetical protein
VGNIWTSPIPGKVQIFAWRLACYGLATLENYNEAFQKATGAASIGGIVRGHGGCVILFFWRILPSCQSA